jgi:hypothetical protein
MNAQRKQANTLVNNLLESSGITDKREQARLRKKVMANLKQESEENHGAFYFALFIGEHLHLNSCWTVLLESYQEQHESLREYVAVEMIGHRQRPLSEARYQRMRSSDSRLEQQIVGCGSPDPTETLLEAVTRRYSEVQKVPFVRPFCLCSEVCGDA